MGKGEIARNERFLLFPHCFQKACFPGASKGVIVLEWVKPLYTIVLDKDRMCMYSTRNDLRSLSGGTVVSVLDS